VEHQATLQPYLQHLWCHVCEGAHFAACHRAVVMFAVAKVTDLHQRPRQPWRHLQQQQATDRPETRCRQSNARYQVLKSCMVGALELWQPWRHLQQQYNIDTRNMLIQSTDSKCRRQPDAMC
jgi:hypothetical protein